MDSISVRTPGQSINQFGFNQKKGSVNNATNAEAVDRTNASGSLPSDLDLVVDF